MRSTYDVKETALAEGRVDAIRTRVYGGTLDHTH